MMMEYVAEQRQWGEAMRRDADGILRGVKLEEVVEEEDPEREVVRQGRFLLFLSCLVLSLWLCAF